MPSTNSMGEVCVPSTNSTLWDHRAHVVVVVVVDF